MILEIQINYIGVNSGIFYVRRLFLKLNSLIMFSFDSIERKEIVKRKVERE